jgi:hypothetical protein
MAESVSPRRTVYVVTLEHGWLEDEPTLLPITTCWALTPARTVVASWPAPSAGLAARS